MSKRVDAQITCPYCNNFYSVKLYRTIWIESPENKTLILEDKINTFECPECKKQNRCDFPFLAHNAKLRFALWYEPYPDNFISTDQIGYAKTFGGDHYLAKAPRIKEWGKFKKEIIRHEQLAQVAVPVTQHRREEQRKNLMPLMRGFLDYLESENTRYGKSTPENPRGPVAVNIIWPALILFSGFSVVFSEMTGGDGLGRLEFFISAAVIATLFWKTRTYSTRLSSWFLWNLGFGIEKRMAPKAVRFAHLAGIVAFIVGGLWWFSHISDFSFLNDQSIHIGTIFVAALCYFLAVELVRGFYWAISVHASDTGFDNKEGKTATEKVSEKDTGAVKDEPQNDEVKITGRITSPERVRDLHYFTLLYASKIAAVLAPAPSEEVRESDKTYVDYLNRHLNHVLVKMKALQFTYCIAVLRLSEKRPGYLKTTSHKGLHRALQGFLTSLAKELKRITALLGEHEADLPSLQSENTIAAQYLKEIPKLMKIILGKDGLNDEDQVRGFVDWFSVNTNVILAENSQRGLNLASIIGEMMRCEIE